MPHLHQEKIPRKGLHHAQQACCCRLVCVGGLQQLHLSRADRQRRTQCVIARHTREYLPFEVYAKALQEYFRNYEETAGDWEQNQSRMYPVLDQYQRDGYGALLKIGGKYGGAFLCDGVGLGKTFVGLMLIERLVKFERKKVQLIVPKSGREPVWESSLRRYLPELFGDFSNLVVVNHTDLQRGGEWAERMERLKQQADVIMVDEAHHFRNPGIKKRRSRYWQMQDLAKDKQVFMLTATPINNRLIDLQHLIEHFTSRQAEHFKDTLGIHSLPGHFRKLEKELQKRLGPELVQSEHSPCYQARHSQQRARYPESGGSHDRRLRPRLSQATPAGLHVQHMV